MTIKQQHNEQPVAPGDVQQVVDALRQAAQNHRLVAHAENRAHDAQKATRA